MKEMYSNLQNYERLISTTKIEITKFRKNLLYTQNMLNIMTQIYFSQSSLN